MTTQDEAAVRVPVEGRPGIWCRRTPSGRVRFEVGYEDAAGVQQWITVAGGLAGAEAALASLERRLRAPQAPGVTFASVAERWLEAETLSDRVRQAYEWALQVHLLPRIGHLRIDDVGEWHAIALLDDLREAGYADWTIHAVLGPLGAVMRHALERGLIARNPFADILLDDDGSKPSAEQGAGAEPAPRPRESTTVVSLRRFRATLTRR